MLTYAHARAEIEKLVETFARNERALHDAQEAQIENNFIRPLFRYLNWNVDNQGLARAQWEFVLQRTERRKRPDYELWLDGRRVLIMDAKKVKYEMHDPRWLNQVYSYAYSTQNDPPTRKTDFAILTDFQEFIVLDCTLLAGTPQAINNFRVLDWRYPDYVARFDELWELFERNHVLRASQTRDAGLWARYLVPKKVKANRVPPDKAFLAALDDVKTGWRVRLAKDMKKHNPALGGDVLTAAVQLWIDRLIFIKVLSDREIEDDYLAQMAEVVERDGLAENHFGWFAATRGIFQKLNQIYNGTIFAPRPELEAVNVSNKVVREIIGELLPENSPYNFASLPVEILGTIYERFLGRVVHATDKQVRIEDKPEVRKAGGVFYTPQYIVNYIVAQTVGKLLAECKTPADVAQLKILDPACGSGSFLIGAYDALIQWHENYYGDKTRWSQRDRDAAYYDADGRVRLTAKLKRQILVNNLFGVDIDAQAVEVTRLSLSLKALEDTRRAELYQEVDLFHQRVLPDLTQNIKCGNSLIGTDFIFTDADELRRVKPFDWRAEFPSVFKRDGFGDVIIAETRHVSSAGLGFDAVIGNPPWLMAGYYVGGEIEYLKHNYISAEGKFDLYYLFIEQATRLINANGQFGMIIPNKFFHTKAATKLREFLASKKLINLLIDFGDERVFSDATNYSAILIFDATQNDSFSFMRATTGLQISESHAIAFNRIGKEPWHFEDNSIQELFTKMEKLGNPLKEIVARFGTGVQSGADRILMLDKEAAIGLGLDENILRPILRGRDVRRYKPVLATKLLVFPYASNDDFDLYNEEVLRSLHPNVLAYLTQNKKKLADRIWFGKNATELSGEWYGMMYLDSAESFRSRHLLTPSLSNKSNFTLGNGTFFVTGTAGVTSIIPKNIAENISYLLGILNSNLLSFFATHHSPIFQGAYYKFSAPYLKQLPIRTIDFTDSADVARHDKLVALVERMLTLHQQRAAAQTETDQQIFQRQIDATDKMIDALVYELYGLTEEEIALVERQ